MHTQIDCLVSAFCQLRELVDRLDAAEYARPGPNGDGSIGRHVRHCLDHGEALLAGTERGVVDYDQRCRGTTVETDPAEAARRLGDLERRLTSLAGHTGREPLSVAVLPRLDCPSKLTLSSLGREAAFVQSHTVHHCAIIAMLARAGGTEIPEHFGYAPATIVHLQRTA